MGTTAIGTALPEIPGNAASRMDFKRPAPMTSQIVRLDDRQLEELATVAESPLPALLPCDGEEFTKLIMTMATMPRRADDDTTGKLRLAILRRVLGHWGSGIEQLGLFFVTYCLMPWFVIWEEAVWMWLLTPAEQQTYYAKYNEGALLRGSLKDQADFLKAALGPNVGYITQNEARETVDRNPIDGGDELPRPGTTVHAIMQEEVSDAK